MISREDIESWLIRMEVRHEEIGEGMWLVEASEGGEEEDSAERTDVRSRIVWHARRF